MPIIPALLWWEMSSPNEGVTMPAVVEDVLGVVDVDVVVVKDSRTQHYSRMFVHAGLANLLDISFEIAPNDFVRLAVVGGTTSLTNPVLIINPD